MKHNLVYLLTRAWASALCKGKLLNQSFFASLIRTQFKEVCPETGETFCFLSLKMFNLN